MNAFSCNVILLYATTEAIISIVPLVRKKGYVHIDNKENNIDGIEVKFSSKHSDFCVLLDSCNKFILFKLEFMVNHLMSCCYWEQIGFFKATWRVINLVIISKVTR